jgi:uncharacterized membrane protein
MLRMPLGIIFLLVVSILIYFGVAQRVLDRLRLSDRVALGVIAAINVGGFINIPLPSRSGLEASINAGGALIPLGLASYLLVTAGTWWERVRSLIGIAVTAGAIYLAGILIGAEPETMFLDPLYLYPLVAGSVAYLTGRSRRGAFIAATAGVILVDLVNYVRHLITGLPGAVLIGGGGAFDAVITSGLLAVMLAELIGEGRERLQGGPATVRAPALLKQLRSPKVTDNQGQSSSDRKDGDRVDRNP